MGGGAAAGGAMAYLGPWRKVLWAARCGAKERFVRACLERLGECVAHDLGCFASHNAALGAIEWHHAVACLEELVALREVDRTFMLHRLALGDVSHEALKRTTCYIEWLAHRIACVVYVARKPMRMLGRRFVPPMYVLPANF